MDDAYRLWYAEDNCVIEFNKKPNTNMVRLLPSMTDKEKQKAAEYPFINCSNLRVRVTYYGQQYEFHVPKGFRWDGATIPWFVWWIVGSKTENRYRLPSMIHDYMCNNKYVVNFNRKLSSDVFRALLRANAVAKWRIGVMYFFVELCQKYWVKEWV